MSLDPDPASEGHDRAGEDKIQSDSAEDPSSKTDNAAQFNPDWRFVVALSSLSVISLMGAIDGTSLSVALPLMADLLHGTAIEAFWAGTSFILTSTVFQPPIGAFSHIFGRKPMLYVSLLFFGAGVIVAAVADNFTVILIGRSIQGIGGGGVTILTEIVFTDMVPLRERGKWLSFLSAMWALGTGSGPPIGGALAQNVTWRWIFWINLPFIGLGVPMIALFLTVHHKTSSLLAKLRRIDWVGTIGFIAATTGFLIPLSWGGTMYSWTSWRTLVPLILCGVALVALVIYEEYVPAEPMIRTAVFKNKTAAATYFATFVHGVLLWCTLYYSPLYFEAVKGLNPIMTGVALFPVSLTVSPMAVASGFAIAHSGKYVWAVWSGWILTTFGFGLLIYLRVSTSTVAWIFIFIVPGIGTGILFSATTIAIQASSSNANMGYAVTMFVFIRSVGQTVGVAIGGAIFQNAMRKKLLTYPLLADRAAEFAREASSLVQVVKAMADGPEKAQLLESYVYALRTVWIVMAALAGTAMIGSMLGTRALPLDRVLETEHGYKARSEVKDMEKMTTEGQ